VRLLFRVILILVMTITLCGISFAADEETKVTAGTIVVKDALYGAAFGAMIGVTIFMIDNANLQAKLGVGILAGMAAGGYLGIMETKGVVDIKDKDDIRLSAPSLIIMRSPNHDIIYGATLLKITL